MANGLSVATNLLASAVSINLDRNQRALQNVVTQLSSGLRVNTSVDDPSGFAIAQSLEAQTQAFTTGALNVQNANNAAQIADGALQSTTQILQRIRGIAVEAATDINSSDDRTHLQTEVLQLLDEVNKIAEKTNFNGQVLLDGSHAGFQPLQNATISITSNAVLATTVNSATNYLISTVVASNANFSTTVGSAVAYNGAGTYATVDGTVEIQVINTGVSVAAEATFINSITGAISVDATLFGASGVEANFENVSISIGTIASADVGQAAYIKIGQFVAALTNPNNPVLSVQSGAEEGDVVTVGIGATNTQTLRISNINVAITSAANPSLGAEDAIGQVDIALQALERERATLGAAVIRLNYDGDDDNVAATNLKASESSIRDLDVGAATTQFTKLQILVSVGTSVLSQSNLNAASVLLLFR